MNKIEVLECKNCGASLRENQKECDYCGTRYRWTHNGPYVGPPVLVDITPQMRKYAYTNSWQTINGPGSAYSW